MTSCLTASWSAPGLRLKKAFTRSLPGSVGFLAAVEAQGYLGDPEATRTTLLEGWGVEKAKRLGASGIKLLVLYRPDSGAVAEAQEQIRKVDREERVGGGPTRDRGCDLMSDEEIPSPPPFLPV